MKKDGGGGGEGGARESKPFELRLPRLSDNTTMTLIERKSAGEKWEERKAKTKSTQARRRVSHFLCDKGTRISSLFLPFSPFFR